MLTRLRQSRWIWIAALICLCAPAGVGHGMVLCVSDGHLAVEPAHGAIAECDASCPLGVIQYSALGCPLSEVICQKAAGCFDIVLSGVNDVSATVRMRAATFAPSVDMHTLAPAIQSSGATLGSIELLPVSPVECSFVPSAQLLRLRSVILLI